MTLALWKRLIVVAPAFLVLHLTATGVLPLLDGFRIIWELAPGQDVRLGAAFSAGYAAAIPFALLLSPTNLRAGLTLALLICIVAAAAMAFYASGYGFALVCLLVLGACAGFSVPVSGRLLGLRGVPPLAAVMSILVLFAWYLSLPFVEMFKTGLPIGDAAGWAGPYIIQAILAVVWMPLVLFTVPSRPPGRFR